jgi:hypothetical protein
MDGETSIKTLAALRVAIGAGAWLAPNFAGSLFGLDVKGNPQAPYLARLFGIRDLALGVGTLVAKGNDRRSILAVGAACDAADAAAAELGRREGYFGAFTAAKLVGTAVLALGLGAAGLKPGSSETA